MGVRAGTVWAPDFTTMSSIQLPLKYFHRSSNGQQTVIMLENKFLESFNIMSISSISPSEKTNKQKMLIYAHQLVHRIATSYIAPLCQWKKASPLGGCSRMQMSHIVLFQGPPPWVSLGAVQSASYPSAFVLTLSPNLPLPLLPTPHLSCTIFSLVQQCLGFQFELLFHTP